MGLHQKQATGGGLHSRSLTYRFRYREVTKHAKLSLCCLRRQSSVVLGHYRPRRKVIRLLQADCVERFGVRWLASHAP